MANVTRYDPFNEMLDDLFKGFFVRPVVYDESRAAQQGQIKVDVREDDKSYVVHAEVPGVKKEDIHVTIEGNHVAIGAETKREREEKQGEKVLRTERYYGKLYRSFSLGHEIDEGGAQARYNNGVLELTLPKKQAGGGKKLSIQ